MVYKMLQENCPYDTGNLHNNIKMEFNGLGNECHIYIDDDTVPYMPYTNEPWISAYWKGRQNPNLYWFDRVAFRAMREIEKMTGSVAKNTRNSKYKAQKWIDKWQNKRGDLFEPDFDVNSMYIANQKNSKELFGFTAGLFGRSFDV